jgi:hypothetical protein
VDLIRKCDKYVSGLNQILFGIGVSYGLALKKLNKFDVIMQMRTALKLGFIIFSASAVVIRGLIFVYSGHFYPQYFLSRLRSVIASAM